MKVQQCEQAIKTAHTQTVSTRFRKSFHLTVTIYETYSK
jgi:hypothetical protein